MFCSVLRLHVVEVMWSLWLNHSTSCFRSDWISNQYLNFYGSIAYFFTSSKHNYNFFLYREALKTRHHSAEQGREAPGECPTPFGLDIGPVTCHGVTMFVPLDFSTTKTSISRPNSGICVKTLFLKCFLTPSATFLVRLIVIYELNYRVHRTRTHKHEQTRSISDTHERKERFAQKFIM